jgi:hypothetical protein
MYGLSTTDSGIRSDGNRQLGWNEARKWFILANPRHYWEYSPFCQIRSDQVLDYWIDFPEASIDDVTLVWELSRFCESDQEMFYVVTIWRRCNVSGRNESSNRKRFSLLRSVYSILLLFDV